MNGRLERDMEYTDFDIAAMRAMGVASCDREIKRLRRKARLLDAAKVMLVMAAFVVIIWGVAIAIDKGF